MSKIKTQALPKNHKRECRSVSGRSIQRVITTQELALAFGVSSKTILRWEQAKKLVFTGELWTDIEMLQSLKGGPRGPSILATTQPILRE